MRKETKITDKLLKLGFELNRDYYGKSAYVFRTPRVSNMRFVHDFAYYEDENQIYINCHKMSGTITIREDELLRDHNGLNTPAKDKWLEIKNQLQGYEFSIFD